MAPNTAVLRPSAAVERSGVDPDMIEDAVIGCGLPEGATGGNIARQIAIRAGTAGHDGRHDRQPVLLIRSAGRRPRLPFRSRSRDLRQCWPAALNPSRSPRDMPTPTWRSSPWILENKPAIYLPMIDTADIVAERYSISREAQDEYALSSQQRTAEAQEAGRYDDEIIPFTTTMAVKDKETGEISQHEVTISRDECNRPGTTLEGLQSLEPVRGPDQYITAGNASQLSDGASACVLMEAAEAEKRNIEPMGAFRGFVVAGCEPDEMGIGPVFAVPRLLERSGLSMDDIGLWELNEAFASQVLYCRDKLGIPQDILNVNGGSISIGHPYGMTGARQVGHVMYEGKRRGVKHVVVTMCIGGGQGAAGLFEIY